jgi:putative FmdB family regulatory protein
VPLYEYECEKCGHRFERIQKVSDPPPKSCPKCKGKVRKLISAPAIRFKGSGWYITDYAKKSSPGKEEGGEKPSGEKEKSSSDKDSSTSAKKDTAPSKKTSD